MNFDDLNDEIGADDWLIPKREITRRKLIKQTSRFKIYKADWFGDVLVYEPIKQHQHNLASRRHLHRASDYGPSPQDVAQVSSATKMDQEAFRSKLSELCLNLRGQAEICTSASSQRKTTLEDDNVDSAYSSISTTPQYHTKHGASSQCEFEFPSTRAVTQTTAVGQQQEMTATSNNNNKSSACCMSPCNSPPVVLNRDSFTFDHSSSSCNSAGSTTTTTATATCTAICGSQQRMASDDKNVMTKCEGQRPVATKAAATATASSGAWFELNELRLVAHENFMLFMGASLDNDDDDADGEHRLAEEARTMNESMEHNASLVMQMSHPKSISLRDLLHANNNNTWAHSSTSSPIDRFFSARSARHQQPVAHLTVEAKLNICQQVTNAMTYLHDKNIVHGRLTSVNIYIELNQRVKISLLDNDEQQIVLDEDDDWRAIAATGRREQSAACRRLNLPALTYLSPELIRSLRVANCDNYQVAAGVHMDTQLITRAADIFAFGTLLFELFEERFPFAASRAASAPATPPLGVFGCSPNGASRHAANAKLFDTLCLESPRSPRFNQQSQPDSTPNREQRHRLVARQGNIKVSASELIYQIGSGQIASRNARSTNGNTPALVDHIISACWAREAHARPSFKQLKFE